MKKSNLSSLIASLFILPILFQVGKVQAASLSDSAVPIKTITIYNNSNEPIYPIMEIPKRAPYVDQWLQAYFHDSADKFLHNYLYRIYINPNSGILPGNSVTIAVPLYSELENQPQPSQSDQYIDWWNGPRIYLYDVSTNLKAAYQADQSKPPVVMYGSLPVLTCSSNSNCEPINVYVGQKDLPPNDPYQLTEYTFGMLTASNPHTPTILDTLDSRFVNYDVSYVDNAYLPVAMEPTGNLNVGYIGTVMSLSNFRSEINKFLQGAAGANWPVFTGNGLTESNPSVAAAYAIFTQPTSFISSPVQAKSNLSQLWNTCITESTPAVGSECSDMQLVNQLFQANYKQTNGTTSTVDTQTLLPYVYGWAPFQTSQGKIVVPLDSTAGIDYQAAYSAYNNLQYSYQGYDKIIGIFNPYVELIHSNDYLNIPTAYAYSADDAAGDSQILGTQVSGDGIIMTVSGSTGLVNNKPLPINNKGNVIVTLGTPIANEPYWAQQYSICGQIQSFASGSNLGESFLVPSTATWPCTVSLKDTAGASYQFTVTKAAPLGSNQEDIQCPNGSDWCKAGVVNPNAQHIDTPPPSSSGPRTPATLYWAPGWNAISGCGIDDPNINGKASAHALTFSLSTQSCMVTLSASPVVANLQVFYNTEGNVTNVSCEVGSNACKTPPSFSPTIVNIATPNAL